MEDGAIGLIDFGQVKQISGRERLTLAEVMVALAERESDDNPDDLATISRLALELGVKLRPGSPKEGPAATAMWLFDGSVQALPGGFDTSEISPNSPVKVLKSFPQELTLVGRSTILIKGIAARLGVRWSLAAAWAPLARRLLARQVPIGALFWETDFFKRGRSSASPNRYLKVNNSSNLVFRVFRVFKDDICSFPECSFSSNISSDVTRGGRFCA